MPPTCRKLKKQDCIDSTTCKWIVGKGCTRKVDETITSPKTKSPKQSPLPKATLKQSPSPKTNKSADAPSAPAEKHPGETLIGTNGMYFISTQVWKWMPVKTKRSPPDLSLRKKLDAIIKMGGRWEAMHLPNYFYRMHHMHSEDEQSIEEFLASVKEPKIKYAGNTDLYKPFIEFLKSRTKLTDSKFDKFEKTLAEFLTKLNHHKKDYICMIVAYIERADQIMRIMDGMVGWSAKNNPIPEFERDFMRKAPYSKELEDDEIFSFAVTVSHYIENAENNLQAAIKTQKKTPKK